MANGLDDPGKSNRRFAFLLALSLVMALSGLATLWFVAGRPYDPFVLSRSDNVRAKALMDAVRAGPLTDVAFNESLALMKSDESIAQLWILAVLELESKRDPGRRERIIAVLKNLPPSSDPKTRQAFTVTLRRISE